MRIRSVQVGRPRQIEGNGREAMSAIFKSSVEGRIATRGNSLEGDEQVESNPDSPTIQEIVELYLGRGAGDRLSRASKLEAIPPSWRTRFANLAQRTA